MGTGRARGVSSGRRWGRRKEMEGILLAPRAGGPGCRVSAAFLPRSEKVVGPAWGAEQDFREGLEREKPARIAGGKSREKRLKRATEDSRLQGPFSETIHWRGNWSCRLQRRGDGRGCFVLFGGRNLQSWRAHCSRSPGSGLRQPHTPPQPPDPDLVQPLPRLGLGLFFPQPGAWGLI